MSEQVKEIEALLARYAKCMDAVTSIQLARVATREIIIPADVQVQLAEAEAEYEGKEDVARGKLDNIKQTVMKKMVALPASEYKTIKASGFMVVAKGFKSQSTIDSDILLKGLNMLAENYPAIAPEISNILSMAKLITVSPRSAVVQVAK